MRNCLRCCQPRPLSLLSIMLAALVSATAVAAPPAGHPSPAQAREMLLPEKPPRPADMPHEGKVVSSTHANEFTYIEVRRTDTKAVEWIAAPKIELKAGSTIRYEDGAVMKDFYSKLLKRTFPSVMFVDSVAVTATR